jgi:hypothetical protein
MNNKIRCLIILLLLSAQTFSQNTKNNEKRFFLSGGYGLAGSFFVRSYQEWAPSPGYRAFFKKNFIGTAQNIALGVAFKKKYELRVGLNFQHFTRQIELKNTTNNVTIDLDHTIHHRDYMWFGSVDKNFPKGNHIFSFGLGIYYLRPKQEEVELFSGSNSSLFTNIERDYNNSRLEEAGAFIEAAYEYRFQPKVNLGIKTQFYYTISAGYAESITLIPYVKILFK